MLSVQSWTHGHDTCLYITCSAFTVNITMLSNWTCLLYTFGLHRHITVQEVFVCTWNNYNQLQGTPVLQLYEKCVHIYIYIYIYIYICVCVCVCVCVRARARARAPAFPRLYNQLFYPVMENVHKAVLVSTPLWGSCHILAKWMKIDQWHCSQGGYVVVAGTRGPGVVPLTNCED